MAIPIREVPPGMNGNGDGGILNRVNPFAILIGMGFASFFTWFISGGGGGNGRRATNTPQYQLGEDVEGHIVTGVRTRWEYQLNDTDPWYNEEAL
jgi:hypothetical protein